MKAGRLHAIASDYIRRHRPRAEGELAYFRDLPTDEKAISQAALSQQRNGKRHPHQRRIPRAALEESRRRLLDNRSELRAAASFDELFNLVEVIIGPIARIGPLTVYDTALRIGAHFGQQPLKVYLHAGTAAGAKALGLDHRVGTLEMDQLPAELRILTAREAEDVLCIYKSKFTSDHE